MHNRHFYLAFLLLALYGLHTTTHAETRLYNVEVIIFTHNNGAGDGEHAVRADLDNTGFFSEQRVTGLSSSSHRMGPASYSLQNDGAHTVLLHRAWRQPAVRASAATAYPVQTEPYSASRVDGTIRLLRGRYLHLDIDLLLHLAQDNATREPGTDSHASAYRLREKRRIKRTQMHYFDHPRFGVLAMVTAHRPVSKDGNDTQEQQPVKDTSQAGASASQTAGSAAENTSSPEQSSE